MAFHLRTYTAPDFSKEKFISAPDVVLKEAPVDMAAPTPHVHLQAMRFLSLEITLTFMHVVRQVQRCCVNPVCRKLWT